MSRIGKQPIKIPDKVEVNIDGNNITIKGPKGELKVQIRPEIEASVQDGQISFNIREQGKNASAFWGLTRALVANAVKGVIEGYNKKLEIQGVGYRARVEGDGLILEMGFSHPINLKTPEGIDFAVEKNIIIVSGIDKQLVGETAAKIRRVRPPEPYKGKGIRYVGEVVLRKAGKRAESAKV
ncbi:50S ribosomal protein L6 [Patescibacteria group bacterium]|nr:50S ribosomal protein L6 [Patescibacteria group bacterium]MBU4162452.1 50S ribosomal protein L6 [Patescibacteria group bacterium]